jgi:APA family basic amino acid/polyamine antiporter
LEEQRTTYIRRLGLFDGIMVVVGGIIGAGIFINPAIVAERVGTAGLTLLSWGIGGTLAIIGALCFGELGSRRPEAGGGYVYLREGFGPLPAFLYGWTQLLVINTGAIAAVAVTFAYYADSLFGLGSALIKPLAVAVIVLLSGVNYFGIRPGSITQNISTVLKLAAVAVLVFTGLALAAGSGDPEPAATASRSALGTIGLLGAALIPVMFAYGGWQHINNVGAEIRRPERNLPIAVVTGVVIVVSAYMLINLAYLRALGVNGLAASTAPAADTMQAIVGPTGARFIAAGIMVSTFGFLNLVILAAPRIYQAMADDGVFFRKAARLHPRYRAPSAAILIQGVWAILLTFSGSYAQLLDYVVFADWIFFGMIVATLFVYRSRRAAPAPEGAFRMPGYPVLPALFVAVAVFIVVSTFRSNALNSMLGAVLILAGIPVFLVWRKRR